MKHNYWQLLIFLPLTTLWISACTNTPATTESIVTSTSPSSKPSVDAHSVKEPQFETIVQGSSMIASLDQPGVFFVSSTDELKNVLNYLDNSEEIELLKQFNFDGTQCMLAVFSYLEGSTSYQFTITRIENNLDTVSLYSQVVAPRPDQLVATVLTNPYHIVQVACADFPNYSNIKWELK